MALITKGEVVVAPFLLCDPGSYEFCPIDVCPIDGGIAMTTHPEFTPTCSICNQPVLLETSKADEHGRAVHEQCYAMKVTRHQEPQPTTNH